MAFVPAQIGFADRTKGIAGFVQLPDQAYALYEGDVEESSASSCLAVSLAYGRDKPQHDVVFDGLPADPGGAGSLRDTHQWRVARAFLRPRRPSWTIGDFPLDHGCT